MSRRTKKRRGFWGDVFYFLVGVILGVLILIGGFKITYQFVNEETQVKMLAFEDNVKKRWTGFFEDIKNVFSKKEKNSADEIEFDGAPLSKVAVLNMNKYIDFTIPYTWTFGKIEVEDKATEETIVITGSDVVMSVSLRNISIKEDIESIRWTREALLYELKNQYPDYTFDKSPIFEDRAAITEGISENANTKMYISVIPAEDKSIFVSYTFQKDDWNAELYFMTALYEMLGKN